MDSGRHTQEENFVEDSIRSIHLHLLDRCLQVGPPINTLINQTKVVVELYVSLTLSQFLDSLRSHELQETWAWDHSAQRNLVPAIPSASSLQDNDKTYLIVELDGISQISGVHWGSTIIDSGHTGVILQFGMKMLDPTMTVEHRRAVG